MAWDLHWFGDLQISKHSHLKVTYKIFSTFSRPKTLVQLNTVLMAIGCVRIEKREKTSNFENYGKGKLQGRFLV